MSKLPECSNFQLCVWSLNDSINAVQSQKQHLICLYKHLICYFVPQIQKANLYF